MFQSMLYSEWAGGVQGNSGAPVGPGGTAETPAFLLLHVVYTRGSEGQVADTNCFWCTT